MLTVQNQRGTHVRKQQTKEFPVMARFPFRYGPKQGFSHSKSGGSLAEGESAFLHQHYSHLRAVRKRFSVRYQEYKIKSDD